MRTLVFLLEEPSARDLLEGFLPTVVPPEVDCVFLVFEGKQDLERNLVRKLKHWRRPESAFVVLRDQDAGDCERVKRALVELVVASGRAPVLVRVACRDLESWIAGDWVAVGSAFGRPQLGQNASKRLFRNPDALGGPVVEHIRRFVPEYQKRDGARRIGPLLRPERNQSTSFRAFYRGLRGLLETPGS